MSEGRSLRIVIAGGGTGGHLFPGIAVARAILARRPEAEISFAGTASGIESRVVPREGFTLDLVRSRGLIGKSPLELARGAAVLPLSAIDAWRILSTRRPRLVIGVGGYSSGPVVLMATLRRIQTMVLEQNAVPGMTNRLLAPFVQAAAVTFPSTVKFFGPKGFTSGNPVRPEFLESSGSDGVPGSDEKPSGTGVLISGGSQGAHAINMAMVEALPELAGRRLDLRVTHQTGTRDLEMVRAAYRQVGMEAHVEPFLHDMGSQLRRADVIVSRAGSTSLAEIAVIGKASILIPLPSPDDHQRKNAETLAAAGAASMLLQRDATGRALADRIIALATDSDARRRMSEAVRAFSKPDAARLIAERALELAEM